MNLSEKNRRTGVEVEIKGIEAAKREFEEIVYARCMREARKAFRHWPEVKQEDAEAEMVAKMWDQWVRLLAAGKDPMRMVRRLIRWAILWVRYDRKIGGRGRHPDVLDFRAGMTAHLMGRQGQLDPHDRSARINGFLDFSGRDARADDPAELAVALETSGVRLATWLG